MADKRIEEIEAQARERISNGIPGVDLLVCEQTGNERLRFVIDSVDGVDLDLCERVTGLFPDLLEEYSLEVSSPGPERPLSAPEHFSEHVGERIRIRTSEPIAGSRNLIGTLVAVDPAQESLLIETEQGAEMKIDFEIIARANLAPSTEQGEYGSDNSEMTESEVNA